jgi:DNA gyrase/topoisomerase IV subunit B
MSYVNCQKTKDGGTHVNAIRSAITEAFGDAGKAVSTYLREGLRCAFHLKIADPQFQGQNKHRLLNPEAVDLINKQVTRNLELFLTENPKIRDAVIQRAAALKKAHETFKKDKEAIKNLAKGRSKSLSLPDKLISASHCSPEQRELFICEGASAAGPIIKARNRPLYQEVYMLKGKITNACRAEMGKVLANADIIGIIQSIGCGILDECDPKRARVGKVFLISDADFDGRHIDALLTAFFITYMAPLVEAGRIYRVKSPLYVATYRDQHWYGTGLSDQAALTDVKDKIPDNLRNKIGRSDGVTITRFKGHGAASADAIRDYALGSKRELEVIRLPIGDADIVANLMGDDVTARKELLAIDW